MKTEVVKTVTYKLAKHLRIEETWTKYEYEIATPEHIPNRSIIVGDGSGFEAKLTLQYFNDTEIEPDSLRRVADEMDKTRSSFESK